MTIRQALEELVEQAVTEGINWAENSSTPIRGVNIDIDLKPFLDSALTSITSEIESMRKDRDEENSHKFSHEECIKLSHYDCGYNSAITDIAKKIRGQNTEKGE